MARDLSGKKVAFLTANEGVEQVELTRPWKAVEGSGGRPVLVAPESGQVQAFNHLDRADTFKVDQTTAQLRVDDFDAVVLPGGVANPDQLRQDEAAVTFLRQMVEAGKPIAVICHGPWTLVEADVVRERTLTSWPSLKTDIRNAGGQWTDQQVVVCEGGPNVIISSRKPDDLDAFCTKLVEVFERQPAGKAA
ncbi:MAG TPA: type 1 glutamine amidotransferase domain-containing protein [Acidimicrobiales bacterium]|nr:type 1 glutamine amidotransferase domain-containing protein [Acidimicrobiales bacterium]